MNVLGLTAVAWLLTTVGAVAAIAYLWDRMLELQDLTEALQDELDELSDNR